MGLLSVLDPGLAKSVSVPAPRACATAQPE